VYRTCCSIEETCAASEREMRLPTSADTRRSHLASQASPARCTCSQTSGNASSMNSGMRTMPSRAPPAVRRIPAGNDADSSVARGSKFAKAGKSMPLSRQVR
jgi:hypothetical protein